jgi:hypothetical protein
MLVYIRKLRSKSQGHRHPWLGLRLTAPSGRYLIAYHCKDTCPIAIASFDSVRSAFGLADTESTPTSLASRCRAFQGSARVKVARSKNGLLR